MTVFAQHKVPRRTATLFIGGALLVGLFAGAAPYAAQAGTADSATGFYTVNGIQYKNFARVITTSSQASASAWIGGNTSSVPTGWAGANGRLFRSSGALVAESGFYYNTGALAAGSWWTNTTGSQSVTGTFYSYGVTKGWTGSGYQAFYTLKSPYQNS